MQLNSAQRSTPFFSMLQLYQSMKTPITMMIQGKILNIIPLAPGSGGASAS